MRVLVGPMSSDPERHTVAYLLTWAPPLKKSSIKIEHAGTKPEVLVRIARRPLIDLVIANVAESNLELAELRLIQPNLSVLHVDLARGVIAPRLFDGDFDGEADDDTVESLARWLRRRAGMTAPEKALPPPEEPAEALRPPEEQVETPLPPRPRLVSLPDGSDRPDADAQLADLSRWIELKLALRLAEIEAEAPQQEFSGWTLSPKRARALLGADVADSTIPRLRKELEAAEARRRNWQCTVDEGARDGSFERVARTLGLNEIEEGLLAFALAPEMHGAYGQAFGVLNDNMLQPRPTLSLLVEMIDGAGAPWELQRHLRGDRPFARFQAVALAKPDPLTPDSQAALVPAPALVALLLGGETAEGSSLYDHVVYPNETFDLQFLPVLQAARDSGKMESAAPTVHLCAAAGDGRELARQLASVRVPAVAGTLALSADGLAGLQERALALALRARIADGILILGTDDLTPEQRAAFTDWAATELAPLVRLLVLQGLEIDPIALRGSPGGILEIRRLMPSREERAAIWTRAAAGRGLALPDDDSRELAATFAFRPDQAEAAVALALGSGAIDAPETIGEAFRDAARNVSRASAPASVRRIETNLDWDDLILPPAIMAELRRLPAQVRHAATVWEKWGFGARIPHGQGVIALFAGPSGTGKSITGQIMARELGTACLQVDLAKTVSKYIGDTAKELKNILAAAEQGAVLQLDEADALFGKRTAIKDAHDRYANFDTSHLLLEIENWRGFAILTTNRPDDIDSAFLRRMSAVINFPSPDPPQRLEILKKLIPAEAPLAPDVDLSVFAEVPLTGGQVSSAVIRAAQYGADDGGVIRMRHFLAAMRTELAKAGMESAGRNLARLIEGGLAAGGER